MLPSLPHPVNIQFLYIVLLNLLPIISIVNICFKYYYYGNYLFTRLISIQKLGQVQISLLQIIIFQSNLLHTRFLFILIVFLNLDFVIGILNIEWM